MMPDWALDLVKYGPLGLFALWFFAIAIPALWSQLFSRSPDKLGLVVLKFRSSTEKDEKLSAFVDALSDRDDKRDELCERHATAIGTIATVLDRHATGAEHQKEVVDELLMIHTDPAVPHSTAQAIQRIEQLHAAALETCKVGREVLDLPSGERAAAICRHCDAIEAILKYGG